MSVIYRQGSMNWRFNQLSILFLGCIICVFVFHLYVDRWYQYNRFNILKHTSGELLQVIRKSAANWSELEQCSTQWEHKADIDTVEIYQNFKFKTNRRWRNKKHFWNKSFEKRYKRLRRDPKRPLLQVFVVPHSHNDPGWLETFEEYYEWRTKYILRNIISNLQKFQNMTFVWSEVIFLEYWWNKASSAQQKALKNLINKGRLEITTGGWVMPDEACTHIYALLDQYIEGHEWLKMNLGVTPKSGWSIDPFGHGPTVPYILDESGFNGTIIQRIHYAWKRWMAEKQIQEFYWVQSWSRKNPVLLVHNMPFDIYSVLSSCGPHREICSNFDFKHDFLTTAEEITDANIRSKSLELIEEYHRIGSLTTHNIVLVPLGDDFRYQSSTEFDKQYKNYTKLFNYINSHKDFLNAHVQFGTPSDYFRAVKTRQSTFPTLKGDFFVYSDIFTSGEPGYWSGYFSSRPYFKQLVRQLEHQLRTSEILYTLTFNSIEISRAESITYKKFEKSYENLITSRRLLGLVQHHDAITGTARMRVIENYGSMLVKSYFDCLRLQELSLKIAMIPNSANHSWPVLHSDLELDAYGEAVTKQILQIPEIGETKVVLFNSLAEARIDVVKIKINNSNIIVFDKHRNEIVQHQLLPIINVNTNVTYVISDSVFQLIFIAKLPALTAVTYTVTRSDELGNLSEIACSKCISLRKSINIEKLPLGDFILENWFFLLVIDRATGFLSKVKLKNSDTEHKVEIKFGAYKTAELQSGPYLFKPDPNRPEFPVLERYLNQSDLLNNIIIISGPILTEIKVVYYPFLIHSVKIYNAGNIALSRGIHIENDVDFEDLPKNRETELFMRIKTDIQNTNPKIEFYTDQNGFQYQKRVKVDKLDIEGNYYPITTMTWIQDNDTRMTYITNHAQGAASFVPGQLEVMLERRMIYDDERGLGEGLFDNKPTLFQSLLTFEKNKQNNKKKEPNKYQLPSRTATYFSRILNYPINIYFYDEEEIKPYVKFVQNFPKDLYLLSLRTISNDEIQTVPSPSCYMILHRPGYDCHVGTKIKRNKKARFSSEFKMNNIIIENISSVTLTGLNKNSDISAMEEIQLKPMELKTILLKFHMK